MMMNDEWVSGSIWEVEHVEGCLVLRYW